MRPTVSDALFIKVSTTADRLGQDRKGYPNWTAAARPELDIEIRSVACAEGEGPIQFFYSDGRGASGLEAARTLLGAAAERGRWLVVHHVSADNALIASNWNLEFENVFETSAYLRSLGIEDWLTNIPPMHSSPAGATGLERTAYREAGWVYETRRLFRKATKNPYYLDIEFWAVAHTARVNRCGLRIDRSAARALGDRFRRKRDDALAQVCREFPGIDTSLLWDSRALRRYCRSQFGIDATALTEGGGDAGLDVGDAQQSVGRLLNLRRQITTWSSYAKQVASLAAGPDERVGIALRYHGAHTGRFTAKNCQGLSVHSLPRGRDPVYAALADMRTLVIPDRGSNFVACDSSANEPRITAFLAEQQNLLDKFAAGQDVYEWFGREAGLDETGERSPMQLRNLCKTAIIGLGFGLGVARFHEQLREEVPSLHRETAERLFETYRKTFPGIIQLRNDYWRAFVRACNGAETEAGRCRFKPAILNGIDDAGVAVSLTSGRELYYRAVERRRAVMPWGDLGWDYWYSDSLSVVSSHSTRRRQDGSKNRGSRSADGRFRRRITAPILIENIVQAIARDVLVGQMYELEKHHGLRIAFSVHDELIVITEECRCAAPDSHDRDCEWTRGRETVAMVMSRVPTALAGLTGLPLACRVSNRVRATYG